MNKDWWKMGKIRGVENKNCEIGNDRNGGRSVCRRDSCEIKGRKRLKSKEFPRIWVGMGICCKNRTGQRNVRENTVEYDLWYNSLVCYRMAYLNHSKDHQATLCEKQKNCEHHRNEYGSKISYHSCFLGKRF